MNVKVDLSGWEGDGTHMSGNIMGQGVESTVPAGVHGGDSVGGSDGIWSLGDPAAMATQLPSGPGGNPSGSLSSEVADWWGCQTAPYTGYDPGYPVNPWDSALPGITQGYLDQVGQGTLGAAGYGGAPTGTSEQDWIVAALNGMGMDASPEAISSLTSLMSCESGGDPNAMNPSGASGLMQMMPETFDAYNVGGDIMDPVSNIMASINYQMGRYGHLVSACPYKEGGFALGPTQALIGEAGTEFVANLDNKKASAQARHSLGTEGINDGMQMLAQRMDILDATLHEQIRVMPQATGTHVYQGTNKNLASDSRTIGAMSNGRNVDARRNVMAGRI
jgi:SLT domain-containing protein